ncbi:MAG TPA: glycosyltransferase family 39 protein [Candidatus Eisenbacteria bacterium]|nr:glycosyltransferase family 39 protein [Candidatus Eisenbacteria bacterium]
MPPPPPLPRAVGLVLLASAALSLALACTFPLVDPDEGRNAEIAREMAAGGDVVIPHLAGMPYLDKPPGLFAAAAVCVRALGDTPLAVRLPAILASLLTLLLLARAARELEGDRQALLATLFTASAPLFAGLAAYVIFDMPLAACVTAVWTLLARELADRPRPGRRAAMFVAVALGVLVKGPVMLAWAVGGSAAAALLLRARAPLRWLAWAPGWLVVGALAGGWFALALRRHPEYARYAFVEESFERLTTGAFHRGQPAWFVPAVLVGGALPWSLATFWRAPRTPGANVAAGFVLFAALFFTLSRSKLVTYLLPAIPALAYWAAECWARSRRGAAWLAAVAAFTPGLLVAGWAPLHARAAASSGAPLARALAGAATVRYEGCYSPGTDFLRGRTGTVVSADGVPLTSNYVVRYRDALRRRGQWTLLTPGEAAPQADAIVRETRRAGSPPPGCVEVFRGPRFTAWRRAPAAR